MDISKSISGLKRGRCWADPFINKDLTDYTISFWIRPVGAGNFGYIFITSAGKTKWTFYLKSLVRPDGQVSFEITYPENLDAIMFLAGPEPTDENGRQCDLTSNPQCNWYQYNKRDNIWVHLAITVERKPPESKTAVGIYIDGGLVDSLLINFPGYDFTVLGEQGVDRSRLDVVSDTETNIAKFEIFERVLGAQALEQSMKSCMHSPGLVGYPMDIDLNSAPFIAMGVDDDYGNASANCKIQSTKMITAAPPPIIKVCALPLETANGSVTSVPGLNTNLPHSGMYKCKVGYTLSDGNTSKEVMCGCDDKWNVGEECKVHTCPLNVSENSIWASTKIGKVTKSIPTSALAIKLCLPGYTHQDGYGPFIIYKCGYGSNVFELDSKEVTSADVQSHLTFAIPQKYDKSRAFNLFLNSIVGTSFPPCVPISNLGKKKSKKSKFANNP